MNLKFHQHFNPLCAKLTKWPNTLKQFIGNLPTNCLSVFGHFVGLALIGLTVTLQFQFTSEDQVPIFYLQRHVARNYSDYMKKGEIWKFRYLACWLNICSRVNFRKHKIYSLHLSSIIFAYVRNSRLLKFLDSGVATSNISIPVLVSGLRQT